LANQGKENAIFVLQSWALYTFIISSLQKPTIFSQICEEYLPFLILKSQGHYRKLFLIPMENKT